MIDSSAIVAQAWQASFGAQTYDDGLSLDACGCDSLQLLDFVLNLERKSGKRLPMAEFHLDLSPRDVEALLNMATASRHHTRRPVFFFPPVGGDRPELASFRAACELSVPMLLMTVPMASLDDPALRMGDFLRDLANRVEAQAEPGVIGLIGYSRGGRLAALTALELIGRGRIISFVAMLDTHGTVVPRAIDPRTRPNHGLRDAYWAAGRAWRRRRWRGLGGWGAEWLARLTAWGLMRLPADSAARGARVMAPAFPAPAQLRLAIDLAAHRLDRHLAAWHAENPWPPGALAMPVILLRAMMQDRPRGADLGWAPHCQNLTIIDVAGDHESMLYAHGTEAAQALTMAVDALARAHV